MSDRASQTELVRIARGFPGGPAGRWVRYAGDRVGQRRGTAEQMNRVNDFAFKIATANGTGSASANGLIMQAIFRMGVPVTGKNVFPSNIQGLPTWYEIRVNKNGYSARTPDFDLMVALNAATYKKDVAEVPHRRLAAVRLHVAARRHAQAPRHHVSRRAPGPDVQRRLQGRARAHPHEEHRVCRRAGRAARDGHRGHQAAPEGEVRPQARADGFEPEGAWRWASTMRRPTCRARSRSGWSGWTRTRTRS